MLLPALHVPRFLTASPPYRWMFPLAITCGNTFLLKPSERVPGASMMLAELCNQAGIPAGVVNMMHGYVTLL